MKAYCLLLFLTFLIKNATAQELETMAQDNSVRPSLLRSNIYNDTSLFNDTIHYSNKDYYSIKRMSYLNIRIRLGALSNYQYRNIFTKDIFAVSSLVSSYHFKEFQIGAEASFFNTFVKDSKGFYRTGLNVAYYLPDFFYGRRSYSKLQISGALESLPSNIRDDINIKYVNDFSLLWNISMLPFKSKSGKPMAVGGYLIAYRPQQNILLYGYSARQAIYEGIGFVKNINLGYGYYRQNLKTIDKGSLFKLELSTKLISQTSPVLLSGAYSVNYRDHNRKNWELGLLLFLHLLADVE